jgi:sigma-B regulation protein RsbU (phosphoserine phosphatase)
MGVVSQVSAESAPKHILEIEHEEAREIQRSLLPAGPILASSFEISYRFAPFGEVGGDFADFFTMPDGRIGLYVGDVVGKGLPAAMYAALIMGMFRGIHKAEEDTAGALALLNKRLIVRPVAGRYAATLYALYNPESRDLMFSNAGLPYPVLVSDAGCTRLGGGGFPSGLFPGATYDLNHVQLAPGDAVLFATDGLHELRDHADQDFSWDKLAEIWKRCRTKSAQESLDLLFDEAMLFAQHGRQNDDITAVVLKVR